MPFYRMPNGNRMHINFGSGNRTAPRPCHAATSPGVICAWISGFACDWKEGDGTCDRPLCERHAFQIDTDKHLCPEHVEAYRGWLRDQAIAY